MERCSRCVPFPLRHTKLMANKVKVIDSNGQQSERKAQWVRKHEEARNGEWRDGVFVFYRNAEERAAAKRECRPAAYGSPGTRAASLMGQVWAEKDRREFPVDTSFWDGRGVLRFWADQASHGRRIDAR